MTDADKVTLSRIIMSPVFFLVFRLTFLPSGVTLAILWILFALIELSDFVDGRIARASDQVSAFGKLFDPFADVIARVTYFLAFASVGIMPFWILLIILYREFAMLFLRMLLSFQGIAMGARPGGKLKAGVYMMAGMSSLMLHSARHLPAFTPWEPVLATATFLIYIAAAVLSLISFADYIVQFLKVYKRT